MEENKAFIVTSGCYSDYGIDAVFDSEEKAQNFIDSFEEPYDEMRIEEFTLNPFEKETREGLKPYFVRMKKDGEFLDVRKEDSAYGFNKGNSAGYDINGDMFCYCYAKDEKHAIKITNEKRTIAIANNEFD